MGRTKTVNKLETVPSPIRKGKKIEKKTVIDNKISIKKYSNQK